MTAQTPHPAPVAAPHARGHARRPGGFTIAELVAVIIVMALLAAVTIPTMSSLGSTRAAVAAAQVQRDATYARERASATGCRSWIVFNTGSNSYSVLAEPVGSPGRANAITLTDPATGLNYTESLNAAQFSGVTLQSAVFDGASEVGFDWLGKPLNNSAAPLTAAGVVTLAGGGGRTVTIYAGTGLATVP